MIKVYFLIIRYLLSRSIFGAQSLRGHEYFRFLILDLRF